jgi:uncharacterized protein YbjT (DUF2867 family)
MADRVFVSGGSGFVGSAVIGGLLGCGYAVNSLMNERPIEPPAGTKGDLRSIKGGLFDAAAVTEAMKGCVAAIHLVGIIMEKPARGVTFEKIHFGGTKSVVDAAKSAGVRRYVHMSALGTRPDAVSEYHKTKWRAEEYVRGSGLDWTIIRPSMIHGPRGEFMVMEAKWARGKAAPFLFMPYFGKGLLGLGGAGMLQPVFVDDVARAFVDALSNPKTIGQTYELGGPDRLTWPALHHAVARAVVGKKRPAIAIPAWKAKLLAKIIPAAMLPFNYDQVVMSQEDNTADMSHFISDFGWTPIGFEKALAQYAAQL